MFCCRQAKPNRFSIFIAHLKALEVPRSISFVASCIFHSVVSIVFVLLSSRVLYSAWDSCRISVCVVWCHMWLVVKNQVCCCFLDMKRWHLFKIQFSMLSFEITWNDETLIYCHNWFPLLYLYIFFMFEFAPGHSVKMWHPHPMFRKCVECRFCIRDHSK